MVNIGIIGAGDISNKFADASRYVDDANIVAVAARSLDKAQQFANQYEIPKAYGSYQELLDNEEIQAVYIGVVNHVHFQVIEMAIKAGKAILCEKPAIIGREEGKKLQALLEEKQVLFMEALWTVYLPAIQKAKQWLDEGRIGALKMIDTTFAFKGEKTPGSRLFEKELIGGGLVDLGVYCIGFAMHMADEMPTQVKAMEFIGDTGVDEYGSLMLRFPNDVIAESHYAVALHRGREAYVYGETGYIKVEEFMRATTIHLYDINNQLIETYVAETKNGFVYELEHFCKLYQTGKMESDVNTIAKTLMYAEIYDQVREQRI